MQNEVTFQPIAGASDYALSSNGFVYNTKTNRRLSRSWSGAGWRTQIKTDDGTNVHLDHADPDSCTRTLPRDSYTPIPDYPDYAVTPYGAVWKVKNLRGARGRHPFIVQVSYRGNQPYVRLKNTEGRKHNIPMSRIMSTCFPNP